MGKRKTQAEFEKEVSDLTNNEYIVLGKYINWQTKITIKHNLCGFVYDVKPDMFLQGSRCPQCKYDKFRKTQEEFVQEVNNLVGDEYVVLGKYRNSQTKVKMKHVTCGFEYETLPTDFIRGRRCPKCMNKKVKQSITKSHETFIKEVYNLFDDEYIVIGQYEGALNKIEVMHVNCGSIFEITPNALLRGGRCSNCFGKDRITTEVFKREIYNLEGDDYTLLGEYVNCKDNVLIKHNICGRVYNTTRTRFIFQERRCPHCKHSNGEEKVSVFLELRDDITFISQYSFDDCRYKYPLRFDFAIFNNSLRNHLLCLIEYDGIFHFKQIIFDGNEEKADLQFKNNQIRDQIKNEYCETNNIPLLRIPYWEFDNIEEIIEKFLNELPN